MQALDVSRSASNVQSRLTAGPLSAELSTEAAVTLFGIGMGVATAVAQLWAARRMNRGGYSEMPLADLAFPLAVAFIGLLVAATLVPDEPSDRTM